MLAAYNKSHHEVMRWSVEEENEKLSWYEVLETDHVVADGRELSWIINSYVNIPHHREKEPQIWTGDFARFIIAHLPTKGGK